MFADNGLWRLVFLINLPLGLLMGAFAWRLIPHTDESGAVPPAPDAIGIGSLSGGFVAALSAVNRWGANDTALAIGTSTAALALLLGYAARSLLSESTPPLDLRLLTAPAFAAALAVMSIVGFVMFTQLSILPVLAGEELASTGRPAVRSPQR